MKLWSIKAHNAPDVKDICESQTCFVAQVGVVQQFLQKRLFERLPGV